MNELITAPADGGDAVSFIREKKIFCGSQFLEIDIFPQSGVQQPKGRGKKTKVSAPKQRNLNDKNAKRYFIQLVNTNFSAADLHVTLTYAIVPDTVDKAEKEAGNYIRRIAHKRKRAGLSPLKYVLVTEYCTWKGDEKPKRIHHHIIMNGGLDRDTIEDLWRRSKKKGQKEGERIGFVNADRLKPNEYGLEALARYLTKDPQGKKRWSSSQNLDKPESQTNDHKYTRRQVERMAKDESENPTFWMKKYTGWSLTECKPEYNDITGWAIHLKMRRDVMPRRKPPNADSRRSHRGRKKSRRRTGKSTS